MLNNNYKDINFCILVIRRILLTGLKSYAVYLYMYTGACAFVCSSLEKGPRSGCIHIYRKILHLASEKIIYCTHTCFPCKFTLKISVLLFFTKQILLTAALCKPLSYFRLLFFPMRDRGWCTWDKVDRWLILTI